jgi:hypothetical protein
VQLRLVDLCRDEPGKPLALRSLPELLEQLLGLTPDMFDAGGALPPALALYVSEGRHKQCIQPHFALRHEGVAALPANDAASDGESAPDSTPAGTAGQRYALLVWEVPARLDLDAPETQTGDWEEAPSVKFDRLLRECRVPIGLLSNAEELRLVYAPLDGASGHIPFRIADMAQSDGRAILDAFLSLLEEKRWFGVRTEDRLPALLVESRQRQAEVTTDLAKQVFEALEILLAGFQAAADRDGGKYAPLYRTLEADEDRVYAGLLTVLLRLVFLLYCEDHKLMPVHELFSEHYSVFKLFDELGRDSDRTPDSMSQRFGAYGRLIALFRLVYLGGQHRALEGEGAAFDLPERRGELFDPSEYPFLEGWGPGGSAPVACAERRREVRVPSVDDGKVHRVLEKLIVFEGQRLSYRSLRVEQIGSVYEALMGFAVRRLESEAVRLRLGGSGSVRFWLEPEALLALPKARRAKWLSDELGFESAQARRVAAAVEGARTPATALEQLESVAGRDGVRAAAGTLVLQPSLERRRTSSHYTPPELAKSVVERALEPLVKTMGPAPKSSSLLNLVICDPAMGSGAFLVAACEYLALQVVAAWAREGQQEGNSHEAAFMRAKRLVAQRCLLGVDKNRYAVQLARISLWLATLSRHEPFTFVDHALRHGDSLVGLSLDQIRAFDWQPARQKPQRSFVDAVLERGVNEALEKRRRILELAHRPDTPTRDKQRLLFQARDALRDLQLLGDVLVGAFFAHERDREREQERLRRRGVVEQWLLAEDDGSDVAARPAPETKAGLRSRLEEYQRELRQMQAPFHWMLEYPEVFCDDRPDPLDGDKPNGAAWVDGFVGNPPFMGQGVLRGALGNAYPDWLFALHEGAGGKCDLAAHFFRRSSFLLGRSGTIGLVATNTIAQGDTREGGLQVLVQEHLRIFRAMTNYQWPGSAAVTVSIVHLAKGAVVTPSAELDGEMVPTIDSRLRADAERTDAQPLPENRHLSFSGCKIGGQGFLLEDAEVEELARTAPRSLERIFRYLGGEEVNSNPNQDAERWVIDFAQMSLEDVSARWPALLTIVSERVKPYRDQVSRESWRRRWWQFAEVYPRMRAAIAPLQRCLVTAIVSKHLIFSFQPTNRIFSHKLYVFAFADITQFAVLQSRIHDSWAWLLCSTMRNAGINYSASDCFDTFPFPARDPRTSFPALEAIGQELYDARAKFMRDTDQGLTKTYNALKDPACDDPRVISMRRQHEALDGAVLDAYGWTDIPVPPFCPRTDAEHAQLQAFKDAVIDRLFVLNAERAARQAPPSPAAARRRRGPPPAALTLPGTDPSAPQPPASPRPLAKARPGRGVVSPTAAANDTAPVTPCRAANAAPSSRRRASPSTDPPAPRAGARGQRKSKGGGGS